MAAFGTARNAASGATSGTPMAWVRAGVCRRSAMFGFAAEPSQTNFVADTRSRIPAIADTRSVKQKRKRVEDPLGETIGGLARPMLPGVQKLDFKFTLTMVVRSHSG